MENGYRHFSFGCKIYMRPEGKGRTKHPSDSPKMTANNSENIRESIFDFITTTSKILRPSF